mmetsp:Transcript_31376/g.60527  ORF Transcript_31376/g.60527 Transcript_31376/m.60527 type:complete len:98 (+) Transcript_31376:27-320(+)
MHACMVLQQDACPARGVTTGGFCLPSAGIRELVNSIFANRKWKNIHGTPREFVPDSPEDVCTSIWAVFYQGAWSILSIFRDLSVFTAIVVNKRHLSR